MSQWDTYRVHRERNIIDQNIRKVLFKESNGKPFEMAIDLIGGLIQFYSILFRFIKKKPLSFFSFLKDFNNIEQINKSLNSIHSFVKRFDEEMPMVKFGEE